MNVRSKAFLSLIVALFLSAAALAETPPRLKLPYKEAGLTERQAAAHALDRLSFGARPGEVDRVVKMGLENWIESQLRGQAAEPELEKRLANYPALTMTPEVMANTYPHPARLRQEAIDAGVVSREGLKDGEDKKEARRAVMEWARTKGYKNPRELIQQLIAQKVVRAIYSENQLHEVLADFWFNHFYVSLTDNQCRMQILTYERDAIRPHVTGRFRELLGATAKHPAMLLYLDNAQSTASKEAVTTLDDKMQDMPAGVRREVEQKTANLRRNRRGINENYARELMELHTLGVDGGYTQKDVSELARVLTGWTVNPAIAGRKLAQLKRAEKVGLVLQGGFMFRPDTHDSGAKVILGRKFPAGRGLEEGEQALDMLAAHPSTAKFVCHKLACWFVSDKPPASLEKKLTATFQRSGGDIQQVMRTLVQSPEFWSSEARQAKIKSPLEVAASSLRALGADVRPTRELYDWITSMGQPLYGYQAPTGFPDRAESWVNTGSVLTRMNFALNLAGGRIPGVRFDLKALNGGREPENLDRALEVYCRLLLPERDTAKMVQQLKPLANNPDLARKVAEQAPAPSRQPMGDEEAPLPKTRKPATGPVSPLAQVVGVILGSPEFQRQ
ncbi:MAG: DUF1800 domain-containing protein [Candidatus Eremiobacterota bacterium]